MLAKKIEQQVTPQAVNNEEVYLSMQVTKYNELGFRQERIIVLTNYAIYNMKKSSVKRRIPYENLDAITLSTMSSEFVLHIKKDYDYRFLSFENKNVIIEYILKIMSAVRNLCTMFQLYYVPMINLNRVMTTSALKEKGNFVRPSSTYQKIMNLEKFIEEEKQENDRKTELRKRTTMLFTNDKKTKKEICLDDFELLKVLGKGAFGKVFLAQKRDTKKLYAIKVLKKDQIIELDQLEHAKAEKLVLQHINHEFLVNLEYAFQTPEKLYFVMEFMQGGELFQHLRKFKRFPEKQAKFYAACITLALGHMHNKNYIYRDLKLENILLDTDGYAKLTDFGLAKLIKKEEVALTFCGTPEYLAPEVILGKGHNRPADWWTLGILIYEMMYGIPPFYSSQVNDMYKKAIREKVMFRKTPETTNDAKDIILRLLRKNPKQRLGSQADSLEVMNHPWFKDIDWALLIDKKLPSPFVPKVVGDSWLQNFDKDFTSEEVRDSVAKVDLDKLKKFQKEFEELNYNIEDEKE